METGEKRKHANGLGVEGSVNAGGVATGRVFVLKGGVGLGLVKDGLKCRARAEAANVDLFIFDTADHVHVEHGDGFGERQSGIPDPGRRAQEAQLFTGKICEEDTALELALERGKKAR